MKIRSGFVSNSSSTSFLMFGVVLDDVSDIKTEKVQELLENGDEFLDHYEIAELGLGWDTGDIDWYIPEYEEYIYIGQSWSKVKDDETGLQFKERTLKKINELLNTDYKLEDLRTIEESWYG